MIMKFIKKIDEFEQILKEIQKSLSYIFYPNFLFPKITNFWNIYDFEKILSKWSP